jgi:hypothetical protein
MQNAANVAIVTTMIGGASNVAKRTRVFRDGRRRWTNADPRSVVGEKMMTDAIVGYEGG